MCELVGLSPNNHHASLYNSVVGTLNCFWPAQCSVSVSGEHAGDPLLDMELRHTSAAAVSRTDASLNIPVS